MPWGERETPWVPCGCRGLPGGEGVGSGVCRRCVGRCKGGVESSGSVAAVSSRWVDEEVVSSWLAVVSNK